MKPFGSIVSATPGGIGKMNLYTRLEIKTALVLLIALAFLPVWGQKGKQSGNVKSPPLRYVFIENRIDDGGDRRILQVLMDEKAFSERNLRILFELIGKRFPNDDLVVSVFTSLEDAPTPEERDEGSISEETESRPVKHYWAVYLRHEGYDFFRYSPVGDLNGNRVVEMMKKRP